MFENNSKQVRIFCFYEIFVYIYILETSKFFRKVVPVWVLKAHFFLKQNKTDLNNTLQ